MQETDTATAGSRRHRKQEMPAKRTTSPKFALNRIKRRFARLRQFRSIWKEYEAVRRYKKKLRRKQGKTDTAKPCKQRLKSLSKFVVIF